jgi:hypothetical protein
VNVCLLIFEKMRDIYLIMWHTNMLLLKDTA